MAENPADGIVPNDFPELSNLVWNRNPARPIEREQVFELYERNWRHVDVDNLAEREADLIDDLTQEFGKGFLLVGR